MLRFASALGIALIAGLVSAPAPASPPRPDSTVTSPPPHCPAEFEQRVNRLLQRPDLAPAQWGILIQPLGQPTPLFSHQGAKLFIPASTQKLLTTAIALDQLGPNFQFQTPVYGQPSPGNPEQLLTLQVVASGDPTLQPQDLEVIAETLKTKGIRQIEQLQLVDQIPPEQQHRPSWEWDDLQYYYAPAINQAILADNQVTLTLTPQALGEPLNVSWSTAIAPRQWRVINQTRTVVNPQQPVQIYHHRAKGELILQGELGPEEDGDRTGLAIPDPAQYFLDSLKQSLEQRGITVNRAEITPNSSPMTANPLLTLRSPPLSDLIKTINQNSDNLYAEALFNQLLRLDAPPSRDGFWTDRLRALGIAASPLRVKDGSGLSRQNLISPQTLVQLLTALAQSPQGSIYLDSLPVAGESGTLKNRFTDPTLTGRVRAKTGTLTGVVTLAGLLDVAPEPLVFSVMVNNSDLAAPALREALDQIVRWSAQVKPCD